MAWFPAPRQFERRAAFYEQLAQLTGAGVPLPSALEMIQRNPVVRADRPALRRVLAHLGGGGTLAEALAAAGPWLPAFDVALLQAGEQSGRLPECFQLLARHYAAVAQLGRDLVANLAYPVVLLHAAVLLFPFPDLFLTGDFGTYAARTLGVLLPFYAAALLVLYALGGRHSETWRGLLEVWVSGLPVVGAARRAQALARLASALEALINAGVGIIEAWRIAARASGSPALQRCVDAWGPALQRGRTPAELVAESPLFPEVFARLYSTGELTGRLDESLLSLARLHQDEAARKFKRLAEWLPRLFYLAVMLAIAWKILAFWTGYFRQVEDVINSVP